jgi:arginyl-tRNA synthetase
VFSFERMVALDRNTAPTCSTHTRGPPRSRQAGETCRIMTALTEPAEKAFAVKLAAFAEVCSAVTATLEPHRWRTYVYEAAGACTSFYESAWS